MRSPRFDAGDRAEVLYRRGCVEFKQGEIANATSLFTRALGLSEQTPRIRTLLTANIYEWRSRCLQFRRDWDAAGLDAERSLELATSAGDEPAQAHALFQASCVAERRKNWLVARYYGERALELYRRARRHALDRADAEQPRRHRLPARRRRDWRSRISSRPRRRRPQPGAIRISRRPSTRSPTSSSGPAARSKRACARSAPSSCSPVASTFATSSETHSSIVARSLAAEGDYTLAVEWIAAAEHIFEELGSTSHLAFAWLTRGDITRETGDVDTAADLYRRAADSLQDVHF